MTLIELIVTIALIGIVSGTLMKMIQSFYKNNAFLLEQTAALDSTRRGVNDTITVLRQVSYGDDGSYPIAVAGTSTITVYADTDQDNGIERVRYTLLNNVLYRATSNASGTPPLYSTSESTTTIATNVRNSSSTPLFAYYDNTGTQLSTTSLSIAAISAIRVMLLVDLNPTRAPNVFTLSETVTLRNVQR